MKRRFFSYFIAVVGLIFMIKHWASPKTKKSTQFPSEYSNQGNSWLLMRNVSPQELPREYQEWLNPDIPLPKSNDFIPTKIGFGSVLFWLIGGLFFVVMGSDGLYMSYDVFRQGGEKGQIGIAIFFTLIGFAFFTLSFFNFKFLRDELEMLRAKWRGRLRYGIFLSSSMMLIHLSNENISFITKGDLGSHRSHKVCHLIPRDMIENVEIKSRLVPRPGMRTVIWRSEIIISLNTTSYDVLKDWNQVSFSANALTIQGHELAETLKQWSYTGVLENTRAIIGVT